MKKFLLTLMLLAALVPGASAAKKDFTVAASNVDGLPPEVPVNYGVGSTTVKMNPDGSVERGASRMGELFGERLWDIIGLSEDFNYHSFIVDPIKTYYRASTYRGKIEQSNLDGSIIGYLSKSVHMDTDGLCLLSRKKTKVLSEEIVKWNSWNGYDDQGADGLILKGFRKYEVVVEGKLVVDVYILHMDAETNDGDLQARTDQLKQLSSYILNSGTKNPIIILGDTNCRYTRDTLKENLIDAINADPRFEIHDPWVDLMWDGVYPEFGADAMMVGTYGEQKGEVVDKIFYINNTDSECTLTCNSYLHDDSFTYADGSQISDHYPVVANLTIEGPDSEEKDEFVIPEAPVKKAVENGGTYVLRNVGTGQFLRAGGAWTTQAVLDDYGSWVTLEGSGNKFALSTRHENGSGKHYINGGYYFDQATADWTLTQIDKNVYALSFGGTAVGAVNGLLADVSQQNTSDPTQQWEFLTKEDLFHELYYAKSSDPKDATFLLLAPDFGYCNMDKEAAWNPSAGRNASYKFFRGTKDTNGDYQNISGLMFSNSSGYSSSNRTWSMKQEVTGIPAGTYKISYQALTYNLGDNQTLKFNETAGTFSHVDSDPGRETVVKNLDAGMYMQEVTIIVPSTGDYANKIVIDLNKTATKSPTGTYFDNFRIKCIGLEGSIDEEVYERVKKAIDDAQEKADELGIVFNNTAVETLWEEQEIVGDGWNEVNRTYQNLAEATLKIPTLPADYTTVLLNPSFELYPDYHRADYNIGGAYPFGWIYPTVYANDSGVWQKDDENKATTGGDGEYLYNTWEWGDGGGYALKQSVSLTPGVYKLSAKIASEFGHTIYLFAGDQHVGIQADQAGKNQFVDGELTFTYSGGAPIEIGVAGGNSDGSWNANGDRYYKADDFRLTRIGDADMITGLDMVQTAINDVTERVKKYNKSLDLSKYQEMVDNLTISGDGTVEFYEIYNLFHAIVYAQYGNNVDMTDAIINNSFEFGNLYGWQSIPSGDTGVKPNSDGTYTTANCDGDYLFNTWSLGTPITQTIFSLPAGHYRLNALAVTGDTNDDRWVYLLANGQRSDAILISHDKAGDMTDVSFEFDVADTSDVTIGLVSATEDGSYAENGGVWYKADNFRLTYLGAADMTIFYDALQAAINDATSTISTLPEEYQSGWTSEMAPYLDIVTNKTLEGDGTKEIAEIYALMQQYIFNQDFEDADMTSAILNHSFELGNSTHWIVSENRNDTGVKENSNGTYHVDNADGDYVFNTWDGGDWGADISQTIVGLNPGVYKLSALLTTDGGSKVALFVNDLAQDITATSITQFETAEIEFVITEPNSSITFGARSVNHWYKADNFRLTLVAPYKELEKMASAVNTTFQMVTGEEFYILGNHSTDGMHAMCHDFSGKPVLATSNNDVTHIISKAKPFILGLDEDGFYLVEKTTASNIRAAVSRAAEPAYRVEYELGEGNALTTKITDGNGNVLGFNEMNKTFGFESSHTQPAMLMTAAYDETYTGVDQIITDENQIVNVYTITGAMVKKNVVAGDALNGLAPGFYILSNGTRIIKQ